MTTKRVVAYGTVEEHAENIGERMTALGCSAEYVAAARQQVIADTVPRGEYGDPQLRAG